MHAKRSRPTMVAAWISVVVVLVAGYAGAANLRGNLIHDGSQQGLYIVMAFQFDWTNPWAGMDARPVPGPYEIPDVHDNRSYCLFSWRDVNGNMRPNVWEPLGWYGEPFPEFVRVGTEDVEDLDIELRTRAFTAEITGRVMFDGVQQGMIWVVPHLGAQFSPWNICGTPWILGEPGDYWTFVFKPETYYISSWVDTNWNLLPDPGEPFGTMGPVHVTTAGETYTAPDLPLSNPSVAVEETTWSAVKSLYGR